jgi:hypothetical protein
MLIQVEQIRIPDGIGPKLSLAHVKENGSALQTMMVLVPLPWRVMGSLLKLLAA